MTSTPDSITFAELAQIANPHRQEITDKLKAVHDAADVAGDPTFADTVDALHRALADGDQALVDIMNRRDANQAQPMDGGGGGNKNPN